MERKDSSCRTPMRLAASNRHAGIVMLAVLCIAGCSSQVSSTSLSPGPASSLGPSQTYFGPINAGSLGAGSSFTFSIDHAANTFLQDAYDPASGDVSYVLTSGSFTTLATGVLNVGVTYGNGGPAQGTFYNPPQSINWALEWPGQGGFAGLNRQIVTPFAPNQTCLSQPTPQTYQFVTFPNAGDSTGTAYGSVSISTSGGTVNFSNISQFNISGGAAVDLFSPPIPIPVSATGTCGPTVYGQTISVPNTDTVTYSGGGQTQTPSATIAIGPTGFLVEGNGYPVSHPIYDNIMGAGLGALGLPQPSSPLSASALVKAQYTGFVYSTGASGNPNGGVPVAVPSASTIASFGYSTQTACPTLPAPTGTILYGGDFKNNDPSSNAGNCDFAVDLGAQDAKNNGLFPNAKVWVGSSFPGNNTGGSYSSPAVAIAAQLQGKYAIFLIGLDVTGLKLVSQGLQTQDWGVYLLQSN